MTEWRQVLTSRDKEIGIEPPCDGSPYCAGAIHIRQKIGDDWMEVHLSKADIKWIRKELKRILTVGRS